MDTVSFHQSGYVPPSAFYFEVKFPEFPELDSSFQEVSGLKVTLSTKEKREGGNNYSVYYLPDATKYENLVLKRCLMSESSLEVWCRKAIEDFSFDPKNIQLSLLGADGTPLSSWSIIQVYPISWELGSLESKKNELAIETITLKYRSFKKIK